MSDWQEASLAELAEYINGRAIKPEECSTQQGIPVIRIKQINDPQSIEDRFCGEDLEEKNIARSGDLLFSWSATLKTILWQGPTGAINQHIFKVLPKEGIDKTFLHYLIDYSIPALTEESHGSTMKHIKKSSLSALHLQIPPLPEQKKIAEILSGIDKHITLLHKKIDSLQRQKKATLNLLYGSTFVSSKSLQDLCEEDICYGVLQYNENGIAQVPVVQIKNLDSWDLATMKHIPTSLDKKFARSRIQGGDLLISVKGSVGKIAVVPEGFSGNISRDIARVRTLSSAITADFLKYWFASDHGAESLARIEVGTTRAELSIGKLRTLKVSYPPIERQGKICDIARSIDRTLSSLKESLEKQEILKKGISIDLLSGRKRVSV